MPAAARPHLDGVAVGDAAASVDRTLAVLKLLRDCGAPWATEAAEELGVSVARDPLARLAVPRGRSST